MKWPVPSRIVINQDEFIRLMCDAGYDEARAEQVAARLFRAHPKYRSMAEWTISAVYANRRRLGGRVHA